MYVISFNGKKSKLSYCKYEVLETEIRQFNVIVTKLSSTLQLNKSLNKKMQRSTLIFQ